MAKKRAAPKCPTGSKFTKKACRDARGDNVLSYTLQRQKASKGGVARPAEFDYWTASAVSAMPGAKDRTSCVTEQVEYLGKTQGVQTKKIKTVRLPFRCPPGAEVVKVGKGEKGKSVCMFDGKAVDPVRDWSCGPSNKPCGTSRKTCPVQFVWRDGKPNLRFCKTLITFEGEGADQKRITRPTPGPGWLVPVKSAQEAAKLAKEACERWTANKNTLYADDPVVKLALKAYPESGGLGGKRRARRTRRK
jgi:hypothetical protein